MSDGSLIFDTKIDTGGFKKGMSSLSSAGKKGLGGLQKGFKALGTAASAGLKVVNASIIATAGATAAIGVASIKVGAEFEQGMSQVAATMGFTADEIRGGSKEFELMKDAAKKAGRETQFSATEASEAMNYLALAGYDAQKSVDTLPGVLNLAAAGGMELGKATDLVTDGMSALGLSTDKTGQFVDEMAKTAQKSNTSVEQLGEAIVRVGKNADGLAGGTVELNTALGLLANVGLKGAEGGTKLRNVIMSLETPTGKAAGALKSLGVETMDAEGNMRGIDEIMKDLNKSMDGMSSSEKKSIMSQIFNKTDMTAALTLLDGVSEGTENLDVLLGELGLPMDKIGSDFDGLVKMAEKAGSEQAFVNDAMEEFGITADEAGVMYGALMGSLDGSDWDSLAADIKNAEGAAEDMAKTMNDNLMGDVKMLKSAMEGLGIEIYEGLGGALRESVQWLSEWTNTLTDVLTGTEGFQDRLIELTGASGSLKEELENLPEGSEGVAKAFGLMITDMMSKLAENIPNIVEKGLELIDSFASGITDNSDVIGESVGTIIASVIEFVSGLYPTFIEMGAELIISILEGVIGNAPKIVDALVNAVTNIIGTLKGMIPKLLGAVKEILTTILGAISDIAPDLVSLVVDLIGSVIKTISEIAPDLLKTVGVLLKEVLGGLMDLLPVVIETLVEIIGHIVDFIGDNLGDVVEAVVNILFLIVDKLIESLPMLVEFALELIDTMYTALVDNLPLLLDKLPALMETIVKALIDSVDKILEVGPEIITSYVQGILSALPNLIRAALGIIEALVDGIVNMLPKLIPVAIEAVLTLVEGVIDSLPLIIEAAVELMSALLEALLMNIPMLLVAAIEIIIALIGGIIGAIPKLMAQIPKIIVAIVQALLGALGLLIQAAIQIIMAIIQGIFVGFPKLVKATLDIMRNIADAFKNFSWINLGKDIIKGIANGIMNMGGWLKDKAVGTVSKVTDGIKGVFKINSPSKLMEDEVGENIILGISVGMEDGMPDILRNIKRDMPDIANTIDDVVNGSQFSIGGPKSNPSATERLTVGSREEFALAGNVNTVIEIDGREIARSTTPYVSEELELKSKRRR